MKNKKAIIVLVLIVTATAAAFLTSTMKAATQVKAETVQTRKISQTISVTGKIEPKEKERIILPTQQKVRKIYAREGEVINKNEVILTIDTSDLEYQLDKYRLNLDLALASYSDIEKKLNQYKTLYEAGAVSKEQFENCQKQVDDQKIQIELAKADIASTQDKINKSTVKAGIDGKIVRLEVQENQYPTNDNNLVIIYNISEYRVRGEVSQYSAVNISPDQTARIKIKGLDKEYAGVVSKIDEAANVKLSSDNQRAKVGIEIKIDNPDEKIKAGYEADMDIAVAESPHAATVDAKSLRPEKDGGQSVFVIENGKAIKKYVQTGLKNDIDIQILEGLKPGEQYIKNPAPDLKEGDRVTVD